MCKFHLAGLFEFNFCKLKRKRVGKRVECVVCETAKCPLKKKEKKK